MFTGSDAEESVVTAPQPEEQQQQQVFRGEFRLPSASLRISVTVDKKSKLIFVIICLGMGVVMYQKTV